MKYLLRHKSNIRHFPQDIKLLDCGGTMEDIFRNNREKDDLFAIDLENFDEMDIVIINSMLKEFPDKIYIIDKSLENGKTSLSDFLCKWQNII